jgi:hypothetical protein
LAVRKLRSRGKGGHWAVLMPNGYTAIVPGGIVKTGLLSDLLKE